jgi:RimJ/RimL family protein N-acetyltransferase
MRGVAATLEPVSLEGDHVRLEPMTLAHVPALSEVAFEPSIWRWMFVNLETPDDVRAYVEAALAGAAAGSELPFVTIDRATGRVVGSTRYLAIALEHRRIEIGWTWIAPAWQRTAINSGAKLLMLEHAFERLGCRRVEFKTDARNERSRTALAGIGAQFEGIFRKHMVLRDGSPRDSAWFAIVDDDWPAVRDRLRDRLARQPAGATSSPTATKPGDTTRP